MRELFGKTAVVTGGASGIGLALVHRFGHAGMRIVIADVEEPNIVSALDELAAAGIEAIGVPTDVAVAESVDVLAHRALEAFGAVHLVCNNAGVGPGGVTWELPIEVWRWVLDVDLWGVIHGVRTFVPLFLAQGEGHVINTASVGGLIASPGMAPYASAKHAVIGLSSSLRADLERAGGTVGVSVLCPTITRSRMNESGRNWPARLGAPPADGLGPGHPETRADYYAKMATMAMDPGVVAECAHRAVVENEFWVAVDPELEDRLLSQVAAQLGKDELFWPRPPSQ